MNDVTQSSGQVADVQPSDLRASVDVRPSGRQDRRALRRRVRAARRQARQVYRRGALLPRTLFGVIGILAAMAVAAGATTAVLYARFDHELTEVERDLTSRIERQAPQIIADVAAAERRTEPALADALVRTTAPGGGDVTAAAVLAASDGERSYWMTSLNAVRASTVSPPAPIHMVIGGVEVAAVVWTWDERGQVALLAAETSPEFHEQMTTRTWTTVEVPVGSELGVAVPSADAAAPLLSQVTAGGTSGTSLSVVGAPGALPLGASVLDASGALVGFTVGATEDGYRVLTIRAACQKVLACTGV